MYLSIGQEGVHSLQEGRVEDVGLVHDKHNLLPLAAGATENVTEVVIKVHSRVLPVDLGTRESQTPTSTDTIAKVTTTIETGKKLEKIFLGNYRSFTDNDLYLLQYKSKIFMD